MENLSPVKMDQQTREEMQNCMMVLRRVAEYARNGKHIESFETFNELRERVAKSHLSVPIRDRMVEEGQRYCFEAHQEKLQEFFDEALHFTRNGDMAQRNLRLKKAGECLGNMKHLTRDGDYIHEMEKRLELIRETNEAGKSRGGKNFKEGAEAKSSGGGSGKRRYLRYDTPTFLVKFPKEAELFRSMDYSMVGMLVHGMPDSLREGKSVHVEISIEGGSSEPFEGEVLVERFLEQKNATALSFKAVSGPTMFFSSNRYIDLSSLRSV
ncbi:MAG: hypothetical protein ORN98_09080 [Alphaproteobacteria bacterium]|nr:hypothetical protein [Alphaproteobacteria bacterium]